MNWKKQLFGLVVLILSTSMIWADSANLSQLERQVRHELVMLPYYGVFDHFEFRVDGSEVTLMGKVSRPTLKSSAENVVKKIEGVSAVVNEIEVLPVSGHDDDIRRSAYRAIYGHSTLSQYAMRAVPPIHIIVDNGKITLEGVVHKDLDKQIAYTQARSVPGVFSVTNNLRLDSDSESDSESGS
jgi:hyperosmotically inducible protein